MFDYHMHSDFSADCDTPMEKTIERAIQLGLEEICFTEHIDYDYPDKDWVFEFNLNTYDQKLTAMQEKYRNKITIKKGVEIGLQPHLLKRYENLMKEETFDFVICSMHSTSGKDLHSGDFTKGKTVEEATRIYYEELYQCIKEYKDYSILGHIDLIKRYTDRLSKNKEHDIIEAIFKEIIPEGKGIEINTSGYRYGLEGGMPSRDIFELYKDCGGEIITLGSDSHVPETLAYQFNKALVMFEDIGFRYISTYDKGKPVFHRIDQLR